MRDKLALISFVIVLGLAAGATPALADEPWYNGCDYVPNDPGGYDFTEACNWHDLCYGGHIDGHSRATCDQVFHQYMDTICYYNYGNSESCRFWAATYYGGTGVFGQCFYDGTWCDGVLGWFQGAWDSWWRYIESCGEDPERCYMY